MKKILLVVPILVLLAAGCGAGPGNKTQSTDNNQAVVTPAPTPKANPSPAAMSGQAWQATLQTSDNTGKGQYMIQTGGHTIYLRSSRDFSALVGKPVSVQYSGTMDSFSLVDITGQ